MVTFSYGALVSEPDSRATRMAMYTGIETVFLVIGSVLSPYIQNYLGLYANFGFNCGCTFLAFLYAMFCVKESPKNKDGTKELPSDEYILKPFPDMIKTIFRQRAYGLHFLIQLQCFLFMCYAVTWSEHMLRYFYMLKTFEGFDGADYSRYNAFEKVTQALGIFVALPIMSIKLRTHDALVISVSLFLETIGYFICGFCDELWQFYVAFGLIFLQHAKYGVIRSLASKCVHREEIG